MKRKKLASSMVLALALYGGAAWGGIPIPSTEDREASFLPPPVSLTEPAQPPAAQPPAVQPVAPKPADAAKSLNDLPPVVVEGKTPPKPESKTEPKTEAAPIVPTDSVPAPVPAAAAPATLAPVSLGKPVTAASLPDIDPQTIGLLSAEEGGLGTLLWQNTPRTLVDRFLFTTSLPTGSATLNALAYRLLVSTAALPEETQGAPKPVRSFTALRIEKLVALGRVAEAWKMAALVKPDTIDDITLRLMTEASLVGPESKEICEKLPALIAAHAKAGEGAQEWQKSLLVCQLRADDIKAVQLGYDMLREQKARDDIFLTLISKNVLAGGKQLPSALTPLRPLNLSVLRHMDVPLPPELYARPDAAMVPELLKARATDDKARLLLAEKAATKGVIAAEVLAEAYDKVPSPAHESDLASMEAGPRLRAQLFRAARDAKEPDKKIEYTQRFLAGLDEVVLTGSLGELAASLVIDIPATDEYRVFAPQGARLFALTGDADRAKEWIALAKDLAPRFAEVGTQLASHWPLFVLSDLVAAKDYDQGLKDWLMVALTPSTDAGKERIRRAQAGDTLMLLAAAGYQVPEDAWIRVMDAGAATKQMMPSPLLLERLAQAAQAGRKGEVVLLALNLADGTAGDPPVLVVAEVVRALRTVGLEAEAKALAREAVTRLVIQ